MNPLAALVCAVFALVHWHHPVEMAAGFWFLMLLAEAARTDLSRRIIPNELNLAIAVVGILLAGASAVWPELLLPVANVGVAERLLGAASMGAPLLVANVVGAGFGGGDIKLLAASGLVLGARLGILALGAGVLLGGLYAAHLRFVEHKPGDATFPLGPSLAFACAAAYAFAPAIMPIVWS